MEVIWFVEHAPAAYDRQGRVRRGGMGQAGVGNDVEGTGLVKATEADFGRGESGRAVQLPVSPIIFVSIRYWVILLFRGHCPACLACEWRGKPDQ